MNNEIGKKIKELRKGLKLTQSELAEPEMTKSMLSRIENGTANPSMKNLQYLAAKLNKSAAYFLEDETEIGKVIIKGEGYFPMEVILEALNKADELIKNKDYGHGLSVLKELLALYKYNEKSKVYGDILYRLAICHIGTNDFNQGEELLNCCIKIYIENTLYVEAARTRLLFLRRPVYNHSYTECKDILKDAYELYSKSSSRDVFLEIEMLAREIPITLAYGDFKSTIALCEKGITLSKENNIYYLADVLYRNIAITYLLQNNFERFTENMDIARKYAEFTGNKYILARIFQNYAMYENMRKEPVKALEYLKGYEENTHERAFYYYLELARAKYLLGNYDEAIKELMKINHEEKIDYKLDCIYLLNSLVLKGLIYSKKEKYKEGIACIEEAIEGMMPFTSIEYKGFADYAYKEISSAYEALSEVYSSLGNYEEAYSSLKKATELKHL